MFESIRQKLRRREPGEPIVIVSGLPRSGTSMMMKMLEAGGMAIMTDAGRDADIDNPKGYFELDFLIDIETDEVWLGELNPRVAGTSALTTIGAFAFADMPLFLFHLLEYCGQDTLAMVRLLEAIYVRMTR